MKRAFLILALILSAAMVLTGCGGGGGGTSAGTSGGGGTTGGGGGGTTSAYAGSSSISGTITVSGSDASAVAQAAQSARLGGLTRSATARAGLTQAADLTEDAAVKLMVVDENGDLADTGIECTLTAGTGSNPSYECPDVKDGVNYVVRYIKLLGNGQAVDMKANVSVPEGTATVADEPVNAKTSVVVTALVDAILDATSGTGIDDATVQSIVDAVATTIETLVDAGVIQVPSMIVEADASTVADLAAEETSNQNLENASGSLLAEDTLATELGVAKTEITAASFDMSSVSTDAEKEAFIQLVFDEMMDDDDMPSFMIQFFGDKYVAGLTMTAQQLMDAVAVGLQLDSAATNAGVTVTKSEAIAAFSTAIGRINTLLAKKDAGTITADEKAELAEVPGIIPGLFPSSDAATWVTNFSTSTTMNVPQGIAFVIYIVDVYLQEKFETAALGPGTATENADGSVDYGKKDYVEFDPMASGGLFDLMGFPAWAQANASSLGIDIFELWLHPGKMWIESSPGNGQEYDTLNAGTCFMNFGDMLSQQQADYSGATVTLTYPKSDGTTATVSLAQEQGGMGGGAGMGDSCWMIDAWMQSGCQNWDWQTENGPCPIDMQYVINDFASGTYTITVTLADSTTATKSYTKKVITGMTDAKATMISPAGQPEWPGNDATQAEMDAFNTAQGSYQMSNFPADVVCDTWDTGNTSVCLDWHDPATGETADAAEINLSWDPPVVTLPDGVKMRYNINVGLDQGCNQGGCNWQHVWSSWDRDRRIYANSFKVPRAVKKLAQGGGQYNVNIDVAFVDRSSGEELGAGGHSWGQFTVQDPLDTSQTFTVNGSVTIYDTSAGWPGTELTSIPSGLNLKAGLITESCDWDILVGDPCTRTIISGTTSAVGTDGTFTVTPTLAHFLDNAAAGSWVDIRVWDDTDDDGAIDQSSAAGGTWENEAWFDWDVTGETHFNVWGGRIEVNTQECTGYSTRQECDQNGAWQWSNQVLTGGETVNFLQDFRYDYWQQP